MQFHETVLDNGLRVIAERNDQARSVACGFFVKAGSRDETADVAEEGADAAPAGDDVETGEKGN